MQKILSNAGYCSRRQAEEYIIDGKVRVNGQVVVQLGAKADPIKDDIRVGKKRIGIPTMKSTWVLFKPTGVICTKDPEERRKTILQYIPKNLHKLGLVNVGRLDMDSQGLLLLTNHGELAYRLTHPKFHVPKIYEVKVRGHVTPKTIRRYARGLVLSTGKRTLPAKVKVIKKLDQGTWIEMEIFEGQNRQVRHMCEAVGHKVSKLKRVAVGPIRLGKLKIGNLRELTPKEYQKLYLSVGL